MVSEPSNRDPQHADFVRLNRTGDPDLRHRLIEAHLPFALHLARRFRQRGVPTDDLNQVARIGLINAVDRFDPDRGVRFTSYAGPTIVGEIKRYFRDGGWAVRVPRSVQELSLALNQRVDPLTHRLGRSPTIAELAQDLGRSDEEVLEALEAGSTYRTRSLDEPRGDDATVGREAGADDPALHDAEQRLLVEELIGIVPKREQLMLRLRYVEHMSQRQIAERLGISQMHVSRLLARSLAELRTASAERSGEGRSWFTHPADG